jgi:sugar lactone lactonase YvrE
MALYSKNTLISRCAPILFASLASLPVIAISLQANSVKAQQASVQLVPAQTLASYPEGSFLESIVIDASGTMYISRHETGEVIKRSPDGTLSTMATNRNGVIAGLGLDNDGTLYAVGGTTGQSQATVYRISEGSIEPTMTLADARFLNGMTLLQPGVFLATDSAAGLVWRIDTQNKTATIWLQDESLRPQTPESQFPGANGIKVFEGAVYVSNSDRRQIVRVPIQADGTAGQPELFASDTVIDDFAFSEDGILYFTTHPTNTVTGLCLDGSRYVIAEASQGVVGSTAVAFGVGGDRNHLYVVGNGGVFAPLNGELQPAKLVQLSINEPICQ